MSASEVARHFKVTVATVYNWVARGLPYREEPRGIQLVKKFDLEDVEQFIKDSRR